MHDKTLPKTCITCRFHYTLRPPGKKPVTVCTLDDRSRRSSHTCLMHKLAVEEDLVKEVADEQEAK